MRLIVVQQGGDFNKIIILLIIGVIYYGFPIYALVSVEMLKRPIRVLKRDWALFYLCGLEIAMEID